MAINPSLLIVPYRYKAAKLYSQLPESGDGDFTVTRGTTATRVNASGLIESVASGVPRLDYTGGGCPSLLVEPAATNLALRSEEFDDAYWTKNNATIGANVAVAPDGASTADKIIANNAAGINANITRQSISFASGTPITFSVFLKEDGFSWSRIRLFDRRDGGGYNQFVNLAAGTLGTTPAGLTATIQPFGNGWHRVVMSLPSVAGTGLIDVFVGSAASDGVADVNGNGVLGILAWGAQLETGSVATSYIPTVASTVTRNADVISLSSVSGLIGQTQGTIYAEVDLRNINTGIARRILTLSDNTSGNRIQIATGTSSSVIQAIINEGGVSQTNIISGIAYSGLVKIAIAYALNNVVFYVNGTQIGADTSATIPACSKINLGSAFDGGNQFNGRISAAAIYTSRLSNSELASLTQL